jgi:hypothetical protein
VHLGRLDVTHPELAPGAANAATLHGTQHRALVDTAPRGSLSKGVGHGVTPRGNRRAQRGGRAALMRINIWIVLAILLALLAVTRYLQSTREDTLRICADDAPACER